ncbi:MAG: hypothetical protein SF123_04120 [Chloroflexota bacterium]|nr:hypothetical protein [Chloroflexota bacterium]
MHLRIRLLLLVALLLLLLTSFPVYAQDGASGGLLVTVVERVRFRDGPGQDWAIVRVLEPGVQINLDGRAPGGGWSRGIIADGTIGWVIDTSISASAEQIAALPAVWTDTPFTLAPPAGGSAPAAPASPTGQPAAASTPVPEAAAPAAPAAVPPPVNAAPPPRGFGLGGHVAGFDERSVNYMRQAGMTWIKKQVRHSPGANPNDVAGLINEAKSYGFRVLLGVVGTSRDYIGLSGYFEDYAAFVGGLAALGADAIEVWNEPNIDREWPSGQIDPGRYTQLLALSYNAIKAANPNTLVISGAPAPTGFFGGCSGVGCDDNLFVQGMAAAGAARYMDCLGIHYNEGILPPTATSGDPRGSSSHYSRYYPSMVNTYWRAFGGARQLCFTELGYLSPEGFGPLPGAFGWAENVTVAQQAAWLDQVVSMAASSGRVRILIIWNVNFTNYDADPMAGFAIIRPDGSCPACAALGS